MNYNIHVHAIGCKNQSVSRWYGHFPYRYVLVMKLILLLTIAFSLHVAAHTKAQQISLHVENETLENVLKEIRKQSGYAFMYNSRYLQQARPVTLNIKEKEIGQALSMLFATQPFTYTIKNKVITIVPKKEPTQHHSREEEQQQRTIRGRVTDSIGKPLANVTIALKENNRQQVQTDASGSYALTNVPVNAVLVFRLLGYEQVELPAINSVINITLRHAFNQIAEVNIVHTGFEQLSVEKATGSFVQIDNELLNRRVSTNVLDRLDGVTSALIFNKNRNSQMNESTISIRGRSTIFANPEPLIVLDNFPYEGDINIINPNDIESVTVLKDAAAASIWGAYSGNGVIVITTKKGSKNQRTKVDANTSVNVIEKPNLYYLPQLSSSQVIEAEKFLYEKGHYNFDFTNAFRPYISPVVEILRAESDPAIAEALIAPYRNIDKRADLEKYVYRQSVNQQHAVSLSGGGQSNQYYLSVGYDGNKGNMDNDLYKRLTINARNTFSFLDDRIKLSSGIILTSSNTSRPWSSAYPVSFGTARPYERLVDEVGNPIAANSQYRQHYLDTVGQGLLLDWNRRPLDEINNANNQSQLTDYRINTELEYRIVEGVSLRGLYQFSKGVTNEENLYDINSYYTRNLINQYSQINYTNGTVTRPIPVGDILDAKYATLNSHQFRLQANLNKTFNTAHSITAIAGYEIRTMRTQNSPQERLYGYNQETEAYALIDFTEQYRMYSGAFSTIPRNASFGSLRYATADNNISYYANANYTYADRYILSGSARFDQSNIFGVNANQKGVPLWSVGGAWNIHEEAFYHSDALPYLKLRLTYGYNGNVDKSTSAFVTAGNTSNNYFGRSALRVVNPPNPELRWEQIGILNVGLDFRSKGGRINGSIEYYTKRGKDLIGDSPFAPQAGITQFRGNVADIAGKGFDLFLNTENLTGGLKWSTTLLYNYAEDRIVDYKMPITSANTVLSTTSLNPVNDRPLYGIYSYKWAGLDGAGNPQGWLEGDPSINYAALSQSADYMDVLNFHGSAQPIHFGSLRNTLSYRGIGLSFNILYKMGYYYRENLLPNTPFFNFPVYPNFDSRWINPGDEQITSVPSLVYPNNVNRTIFYERSELHVQKGDHIRLQDIQLSYELGTYTRKWGLNNARVFFYANNIGILWRAGKGSIDPDFISVMPNPRSYAIGLSFNL